MLDPDTCPADPEVVGRDYLLHKLTPEEERVWEDHYITCDRCARVLEEVNAIITALRGVGRNGK
jgi:anti-sigma factor RsiW